MYHKIIFIGVIIFSAEIQCQRHIIGSRLLNFDNPMKFASSSIRRQRNSKDVKFNSLKSGSSNIRTVKDSSFNNPKSKSDFAVNDGNEFENMTISF